MSSNGQPKVEISYIGCTQIEKETKNIWGSKKKNYLQQFSIKLKLLSTIDKDVCDITQSKLKSLTEKESKLIIPQVQKVITFFKTCLYENKNFTVDINISKASEELYNKYRDTIANKDKTVEGFIRNAPHQILLQGITIKLRANIKDINLDNLYKIESRLDEKLKQAEAIENKKEQSEIEPTHQETEQNKQVVPVGGSFGFNVANRVNDKAPVVFAAIENNIPKYRIFFPLSNFFNDVIRLFFSRTPKLSVRKHKAIQGPEEVKQDEVTVKKETKPSSQQKIDIPQNHVVADEIQPTFTQVKENHTENKHITAEPTLVQKTGKFLGVINDDDIKVQGIIKLARNYAETAMISNEIEANEKQKTLDEIFCETVITYYDPKYPKFFIEIIESVFKTIFLKDISKKREISETDILNTLKKFGLKFNKDYLIQQVDQKKEELYSLIKCNSTSGKSNVNKSIIEEAQKKAQGEIKNNNDKTRDEIFIEVMKNYRDQDRATFVYIFDTVFNSIFCEDKNPDEIEAFEEIFNILKILEVQFNVKYLQNMVLDKKTQLSALVLDRINPQPPMQSETTTHKSTNPSPSNIEKNQTPHPLPKKKAKTQFINIRLKLSLETVLSSKETYFCLIVIGAFIFTLCLWHFPLGKVSILQGLVPEKKREDIGLILNIGLPILIALCVLNLAHFLYSEYKGYSVKSVEQASTDKLLSPPIITK